MSDPLRNTINVDSGPQNNFVTSLRIFSGFILRENELMPKFFHLQVKLFDLGLTLFDVLSPLIDQFQNRSKHETIQDIKQDQKMNDLHNQSCIDRYHGCTARLD